MAKAKTKKITTADNWKERAWASLCEDCKCGGPIEDDEIGATGATASSCFRCGKGSDDRVAQPGAVEKREWIIQRCTQQWIGTDLQYQDWGPYGAGTMIPVTKTKMLKSLESFQRRWPDEEFRGHNIIHCRCEDHKELKSEPRREGEREV